ncbi:hypothetical protein [Streptomyces sp. NBC_01803]|uniref:hypothetical protein n=1 Tax=Streptomyces sp. NBC_01803 TaxID=2975946 RepID=UPI002DD8AA4A|nr:hypothetical protein [Streptomyces sp. NBC_01803]WSA44351.1 hypothetical protein OIE51_09120 [Streptomyces sp. NBC_01803]
MDILRPLPGRPAAAQRVSAVAAADGLARVAVATAAPWFPGFGELLVLEPGSGRPPERLTLVRRAPGAVVRDLVLSRGGAALTASLGGNDEQHVGEVVHWEAGERWRRLVNRPLYMGYGEPGGVRLAVSGDGRTIAGCDQGSRTVVAWAAADGRQVAEPPGVGGSETVAVDTDGSRLAFRLCRPWERAPDGGVAVLGIGSGADADCGTGTGTGTGFAAEGMAAEGAAAEGMAAEGMAAEGMAAEGMAVHATGLDWCSGLVFDPEGRSLAAVGTVAGAAAGVIVDLATGERVGRALAALPGEAWQQIVRPVWGADGPRAAVRAGRTVTVWDLKDGERLLSVPELGRSTAWTLTPDGRALVVATTAEVRAYHLE